MSKRYWVESVDGDEIGDYGGFQFDTWDEAVAFIDTTYKDELALVGDYYESDAEVQRLQIVVLTVDSIHDMPLEGGLV